MGGVVASTNPTWGMLWCRFWNLLRPLPPICSPCVELLERRRDENFNVVWRCPSCHADVIRSTTNNT